MRWKLALALVVTVLAASITMFASLTFHSRHISFPDDKIPWPTRLSQGVELPAGETFRSVDYYPDGINRQYAEGIEPDGGLIFNWFHANGKLKESKKFSALIDGKRTLLRHSLFELNGVSQILDQEYYPSGTLKVLVKKITQTTTFRWYYRESGEVRLFQNYENSPKDGWIKRIADTYRKDGSLEEHYERIDSSTWEIQKFDSQNNRTLLTGVGAWGYKYYEQHFGPDGSTMHRKVEQNSVGTEVWTYYPGSKTVKEYRRYSGTTSTGTLYVHMFDSSGVKTLEQVWLYSNEKKAYFPAWIINYQGGIEKYKLFFFLDSNAVREVHQYLSDEYFAGDRMVFEFNRDGSVKSEQRLDPSNTAISTRNFGTEDQPVLPFKVDTAWYTFYPDLLPPQVVTYDPSDR